jgi:hypothetical protein
MNSAIHTTRNQSCPCGSGKRFKHCHGKHPRPIDYTAGGARQFHDPSIDPLSPSITPIELMSGGKVFGHGTGFTWGANGKLFLITNWHNLSGQNPFDSSYLNEGGRIPDAIQFYPAANTDSGQGLIRYPVLLPLFETFHQPIWKQHRHFFDLRIDIALIEFTDAPGAPPVSDCLTLNRFKEQIKLFSHVGSDVFIVGYPFFETYQNFLSGSEAP